jgi:glucosamine--fructose-6-phosphate aminotransferase (isomerizing)
MASRSPVAADLVAALSRMEYRGYDSAGVAVSGDSLAVRKVVGPASGLRRGLDGACEARAGVAHTRWATHGRPDVRNAHPHVHGGVAVVHNGIIENHHALRDELSGEGLGFLSDTDSEVVPHLMARAIRRGASPLAALVETCGRLEGAYALAVVVEGLEEVVLIARRGAPLVVGRGDDRHAVASDASSLGGFCTEFMPLADGDIGMIEASGLTLVDREDGRPSGTWFPLANHHGEIGSHGFAHYTRKEIAEQPSAIRRTDAVLAGRGVPPALATASRMLLVGCGSSLYAAATARPFLERMTGLACDIEVASEFRYRGAIVAPGTAAVLVSQSGETADTMASLESLTAAGVPTVAVVNVPESSIARGADLVWGTSAGHEIGVAATKTFTSQLVAFLRLGLAVAEARGLGDLEACVEVRAGLEAAPEVCAAAEGLEPRIEALASRFAAEGEALFIGRGWGASVAGEAALKLKELSYLRADAYPAGELKHGPIALVREGSPVVVHVPSDALTAKTMSNAEEVRARGAYVIAMTDRAASAEVSQSAEEVLVVPGEGVAAIFGHVVAVQLLAYHVSLLLGRDPDRPRNLAKSVCVE